MLKKLFYAPGDYLANATTARQRRAAGAWMLILSIIPGVPIWLYYIHSNAYISTISEITFVVSAALIATSETPVEKEQ